jgi:hypothetical protein
VRHKKTNKAFDAAENKAIVNKYNNKWKNKDKQQDIK